MAKQPVDPVKAKEAKQKKIAIGGAVILVILLAIQGPKVMKQMSRSSAPPPAAPTTVASPTATTPVATTPVPGVDPTAGGSGLISETAPTAALGQVSSFGRFASKDPFAAIPGSTPQPADNGGENSGGSEPPVKPPAPPAPPKSSDGGGKTLTSAVIAVNGVKELVSVGGNFPASNPLFHLVSVSDHSVKISIAGGALANGEGSVTLKEGEPLTLMNTSDGTRYKIQLFPQGTKITAAPASTSTTSTPATSTPATTTTDTSGN